MNEKLISYFKEFTGEGQKKKKSQDLVKSKVILSLFC